MCEIDVSGIIDEDCQSLSASQAELGPNAARITWTNCLALAERAPLVNDENRDQAKDHFAAYGAWEQEEINAWTDKELSAMIWQEAAASYREFEYYCEGDLARYHEVSGRLFFSDDGSKVYLYLGV
jgi:hypothetical protein